MSDAEFLDPESLRPWDARVPGSLSAIGYHLGRGQNGLEVVLASATSRPGADDVRRAWKERHANRPSPVLLVVLYDADQGRRASVCGPVGADPVVLPDLDPGQVERIAGSALQEPDRHAATRFLQQALPEAPQELPGIRNVGMLSTHHLREGVPQRPDWDESCRDGKALLERTGRSLVEALGFKIEDRGANTRVLRADGVARVVAIFLDESEAPEANAARFGNATPVSAALAAADADGLPWVILTRGHQIRVYAAGRDVGVGQKGRAETFVEANLALLPDDRAGYLPLLFGSKALREGGTFEQVLENSRDFAAELGARLRERVYNEVVPALAAAVSAHRESEGRPDEKELAALYEQTLVLLFRLLFLAYAEDKDLLPYRSSNAYQRHSLKTIARDLAERRRGGNLDFDQTATDMWSAVNELFRAIDKGNTDWEVPPYNGGLFSSDPEVSPTGAALSSLQLTNAELGPALAALLVDQSEDGLIGPVGFRSLSVREFGTIYEGLLESSLAVAPTDLAVDKEDRFVPAAGGQEIKVHEGAIYLHDRSGLRKSTGSYFTKPFAVQHLLEHALEPALDAHLSRINELVAAGEEAAARDAFFDFRCADIAMGSGHFLVAAVDHIEARLSSFLAHHPIPGIVDELDRLRQVALEQLGELGAGVEIEQATLLRRQVARRCIYGVDRNRIAVELARLAMWIHTFVPGLPLSFLDHNLVPGDSLTGIGTIDEAAEVLDPRSNGREGTISVFAHQVSDLLANAEHALKRLARTSDADAAEIEEAREAHSEAQEAIKPVRRLFDLCCAIRLGEIDPLSSYDPAAVQAHPKLGDAERLTDELQALHFPVSFPEVFLRDRPGFDCILGNPPWEKVKIERHAWWALRFPGLRSMPVSKQNREVDQLESERPDLAEEYEDEVELINAMRGMLIQGPYPGIGTGDPDLYKAFCWRFWHLCREDGSLGVVLPRSAIAGAGGADWRESILDGGAFNDVTLLLNNRKWVFPDVHPQYTVALTSMRKGALHSGPVRLRGPFRSHAIFRSTRDDAVAEFESDELRSWTSGAAMPLLPSERSADVFLKLRVHPRFDEDSAWKVRPIRELDATNDKKHMVLSPESTGGLWPVYKGASFYLWDNDTGEYYAWADPDHVASILQAKRERGNRHTHSAFSEMPAEWISDLSTLPFKHPRIAFRDVTRATDTRTVIASLIPPRVVLNHTAPYLAWPSGDYRDQAYLLGVLCSIPLDWYARRFVEIHVTFDVLNAFPIPRTDRDHPARRRIEEIAGALAATDERYEEWAEAVGVPVGGISDPEEHEDLEAELDACVARLYDLDPDHVRHIFETFHEGWDPSDRLERVLRHMAELPA